MAVEPQSPQDSTAEASGHAAGARRLHPFFRDVGVTLTAQVAVGLGSLLLYRLIAVNAGTQGFASYTLVKQAGGFFFPIVTVGLVGGLPRYLALPRDGSSPTSEAYLAAATLLVGLTTALPAGLALAFPEATAATFFGDADRIALVPPFSALMCATSGFYLAYGYYRGHLRIRAASVLSVSAMAIVPPLVVLAFPDETVDVLILRMAAGIGGISLLAVGKPLLSAMHGANLRRIPIAVRALSTYGYRRVPGEIAQVGLFVVVPLLAAHVATLDQVAYLTAGQQVLGMLAFAVLPLGLVLLPSLTRMWADDRERAASLVGDLSAFACHVAFFLSLQTVVYADVVVRLWLGSAFEDAGAVVRVTVTPAALYVVYLMLRSTLDAVEVRSFNSRNNLIAFAVLVITAAAFLNWELASPIMCVSWAFSIGMLTQGALTFATVHRYFGLSHARYALGLALPPALAAGALGLAARPLVVGAPLELPVLVGLQLVLAGAYFWWLFHSRVGWTQLLAERLFQRG